MPAFRMPYPLVLVSPASKVPRIGARDSAPTEVTVPMKKFLDWLAAAFVLALLALMVGLLAWSAWPALRRQSERGDIHDHHFSGVNTAASHLRSA